MPHQHKQQLQQLQPPEHAHLKKMAANGAAAPASNGHRPHHSHQHRHAHGGEKLQHLSGMLEVKFKGGAFSTWSDVFVRLEGRWLTVHKRERDSLRIGAVELGPGVEVTDLNDTEASTKFPRRFDLMCKGGALPATEMGFRTKSRKDRDLWALAVATNIHILTTVGLDLSYAISDLEPVITRMKEALPLTPIRIRSDLAIRCSSGEDIVAFLVAEELAMDRTHANIIGRRLLAMNVIHHVVWEKGFVDADEQYTLSELDEELGYEVEHFQKFLDSRKFWKYFDSDASSSNGSTRSGRSGRAARSAASTNGSTVSVPRGSAATQSHASVSSQDEASSASASAKLPPSLDAVVADKKAKHCGVCKKGFNPLRRRYVCRSCAATVCSHCSMSRKVESVDEGSVTARVCVGCKLSAGKSQEDFYDQIFTGPQLTATTSASERSGSDRASSFSQTSTSSAPASSFVSEKRVASSSSIQQHGSASSFRRKSSTMSVTSTGSAAAAHGARRLSISSSTAGECPFCMNEGCGPLRDYFEVPYPVAQEVVDRDGCNYITANELDNEHARLRSVRILIDALATGALTQSLLHFCSMATIATSSPIALVGLLARSEYVVVAQNGEPSLADHSIPRDKSFAAHTCRNGVPLVCSDLSRDVRFAGNPWRRDVLHASFYAGIPITLSNGHTVGAIEVFDVNARYACTEVVTQLQAVVRGVVKKMDDAVASAPLDEYAHQAEEYEMDDLASVSSIDSSMSVESRPDTSVAQTTAPPPAPAAAAVQEDESSGSGDAAGAGTQASDNEMELRLMELLSQTTTTQEQLRNQQGHMVNAISSHSKQITELAKQLERMESTLNAKLGGDDNTP